MDKVAAVPQVETAEKLHVSRNTVRSYQDKVGEFIAQVFDINAYRMPFYTLWPEIMASVRANLKKNDVTMTVALCKGLQIFVDKQVNENNDKLDSLSNDELAELISRRLGLAAK